jgi:hypothetical protein
MAIRTEEQKQTPQVSADFPYRQYMSHPAWRVLEEALNDLESNDDLELRTAARYVIGYLVMQLSKQGLTPAALPTGSKNGKIPYRRGLQPINSDSHMSESKSVPVPPYRRLKKQRPTGFYASLAKRKAKS